MSFRYYFERDMREIREAKNYQDLLAIGMRVLQRMADNNPLKPIALICGPISTGGRGSRSENLRVFNRAIIRAEDRGLLVFSQMPFEDVMERIFKSDPSMQGLRLLEEFYLPILESRLVKLACFLRGWDESIGATWEHDQAVKLEIPRVYLSDHYTND